MFNPTSSVITEENSNNIKKLSVNFYHCLLVNSHRNRVMLNGISGKRGSIAGGLAHNQPINSQTKIVKFARLKCKACQELWAKTKIYGQRTCFVGYAHSLCASTPPGTSFLWAFPITMKVCP